MARVNPVNSAELRPLPQPGQPQKSGDPFAMLLDTVSAKRPSAPELRRRADAPEAPRVNGSEKPERPQPKQNAKPAPEKSKPFASGDSASEETEVSEGNSKTRDLNSGQEAGAAETVEAVANAAPEQNAIPVAEIEFASDASGPTETAADTAPVSGDDGAILPEIAADTEIAAQTEAPSQQAAPQPASTPVIDAPAAETTDAPAPVAAVPAKAEAAAKPNQQAAVAADAEDIASGEEAPQAIGQTAKPEATQAPKPAVSNQAEAREAALAETGERAAQSANTSKPEAPALAKEQASAKPAEPTPAQPRADDAAPRQQASPPLPPPMPEPVRALAGSINPVNLRAANDGPFNAVPLNANAIGVEIASRAKEGMRRFDIRLDPPELGRIDVRLEVDSHGKASTRLIVERPETLDLLQRDARNLERALQSAGLQTDEGGLEFSLRDQGQDGLADAGTNGFDRRDEFLAAAIEDAEQASPAVERYARSVFARGGVDIRI